MVGLHRHRNQSFHSVQKTCVLRASFFTGEKAGLSTFSPSSSVVRDNTEFVTPSDTFSLKMISSDDTDHDFVSESKLVHTCIFPSGYSGSAIVILN